MMIPDNAINKVLRTDPYRIAIRKPGPEDGLKVNRLVARCASLDSNSVYCNLLQCTHFADTCAIAQRGAELLGFLSAYVPPEKPETVFVWQVAVSQKARGQGLGKRLIREVLTRPTCRQVRFLEATITRSNQASWNLFLSIARELQCSHETKTLFDAARHFEGMHETEILLRIGPFRSANPIQRKELSYENS